MTASAAVEIPASETPRRRFAPWPALVVIAALLMTTMSQSSFSPSIYAIGDSITHGVGATPGHRWVDLVGAFDAGHDGFTSADALVYPWSVPSSAKVVLIELGVNDYMRGVPSATFEANMTELLARLPARRTLLVAVPKPIPPWSSIEPWSDYVAAMCRLGAVVDIGTFGPELFSADGTHPNDAGDAVIAAKIRSALANPERLTCR